MAYFEFPHTRNYDGDLGWVIKKIIELTDRYNDFFEYNSITFADPLQWDITKQYPPYQIVFDYDAGYSYISKRPVPAGVTITNPDYWCLVGPLIVDAYARSEIQTILEFITNIYEPTNIATAVRAVGDYVTANGQLYKVTAPINIGEGYTEGINVTKTTIETIIHEIIAADTASMISDISTLQGNVGDINHTISNIEEPFTIMIGDSYAEGYDPLGNNRGWPEYLKDKGVRGVSKYQGGAAFWYNTTDNHSPVYLINNVNLPTGVTASDVKRIICAMGYNDTPNINSKESAIRNNFPIFVNTCHNLYPNATVYIAFIGHGWTNNENNVTGSEFVWANNVYRGVTRLTDAVFMDQMTGVLLGCNGLSTGDYKHPSEWGNQCIADGLWNTLHGLPVCHKSDYTIDISDIANSFTGNLYMSVTVNNGIVECFGQLQSCAFNHSSAVNLYQPTIVPARMPCMPFSNAVISKLIKINDHANGLAQSYYSADTTINPGYNASLGLRVHIVNDAGTNFGYANNAQFNDSNYYSWTVAY